jgi:exonuclease III
VACGFPGDPVPEQARVLSVTAGEVRVVNVYVVNGREVDAPEYELKLRWLDAFTAWLRNMHQPASPLIVLGDFNIAPDVYDPGTWRGREPVQQAGTAAPSRPASPCTWMWYTSAQRSSRSAGSAGT